MKKNLTELVFILDRSGSMHGYENDTIGGFNSTIEKQRTQEGTVFVSTVLFDNYSEVIHDRVNIQDIAPLTREQYRVRGSTALYDAIGGAIKHIQNIHKYARPEDVPEHTIFVITTDGMENASHYYSGRYIKNKIEMLREKYGWEFIFLAANIDAGDTAENIGIRRERSANYQQTPEGIGRGYTAMSKAISSVRRGDAQSIDMETLVNEDDSDESTQQ